MRVISPLVGAFVVIMIVTTGLSVLDVTLAITLGGIMLLTLFIMPPVFYRAGKNTGQNLTHLRGQYRQQLTSWLQGRAELTILAPANAIGRKWKPPNYNGMRPNADSLNSPPYRRR